MLLQLSLLFLFAITALAAVTPRNRIRSNALAKRLATVEGVRSDVYRKRQATRAGVIARDAMPRDMRPRASVAPATMCGSSVAGTPYRIRTNIGANTYLTTSPTNSGRLTVVGDATSDIFMFNLDCTLSKQVSTGGQRLSVENAVNSFVLYQPPSQDVSLICSTAANGVLTCVPASNGQFNLVEFRFSPSPSNPSNELTFQPAGATLDTPVTLTVVPA